MKHRHVGLGGAWEDERAGLGWEFVEGEGPPEPQLRGIISRGADARLIALAPDLARWALAARDEMRSYCDERPSAGRATRLRALLARLDEIEKGLE
jgi:hypothetical protein